jgi:hypothetical protein
MNCKPRRINPQQKLVGPVGYLLALMAMNVEDFGSAGNIVSARVRELS